MRERIKTQRHNPEAERTSKPSLRSRLERPVGGRPLESSVQAALSPRLGHSLSSVQIHADAEAHTLASSLGARAFTTGPDIYFRSGAYAPDTPEGLHLLAHELTHVVQQEAGPVPGAETEAGVFVSESSDGHEQAARAAADGVMLGMAAPAVPASAGAPAPGSGGVSVQREDDDDAPFWESGIFHAISGAAGLLPGPVGGVAKLLRHPFQMAEGISGAAEGDVLGGVQGIGGAITSVASGIAGLSGFSALGAGGLGGLFGNLGALGTVGGLGADAGLTMGAGSALTGGGLSGAAALGPAALVAAAGLGGLGIGSLIAEHTGIDEAIGDGLFDLLGPGPGLWLADTFGL